MRGGGKVDEEQRGVRGWVQGLEGMRTVDRFEVDRGWVRGEGKERARRGQGEGKERTRRGQGEDKERTRRGQGEGKERARRGQGEGKERARRGYISST